MIDLVSKCKNIRWLPYVMALLAAVGTNGCGFDGQDDTAPKSLVTSIDALASGTPTEQALIASRAGNTSVKTIKQSGAVMIFHGASETPSNICTGTLIAPNAVLTAAHCLIHHDGTPLDLNVWRLKFSQSDKISTACTCGSTAVSEVMIHPAYTVRDPRSMHLLSQQSAEVQSKVEAASKSVIFQCGTPDAYGLFSRLLWYIGRPTQRMLAQEQTWFDCAKESKLFHLIELSVRESNHDIAVVFLEKPIDDVAPAQLPMYDNEAMFNSSVLLTASAYGTYSQLGDATSMAGTHLAGKIAILEAHPLDLVFEGVGTVVAPGDSGGGIFSETSNPPEIIGVLKLTTTLQRSGRRSNPGFATNVKAYVPWIKQTIEAHNGGFVF